MNSTWLGEFTVRYEILQKRNFKFNNGVMTSQGDSILQLKLTKI